ncbi:MAG: pitrilysin family protein [Acidobacteriota bacterium]
MTVNLLRPLLISSSLLLLWFVISASAQTQPLPNLFGDFETILLPNGLKVWYKRLPNDPNVSITVNVPYGSDCDPVGLEELAHFTEHMLFSDHLGRTEDQIKKELEDRGGVRNAYTTGDHTFYFARIGKDHGLFALEWLYRVLSPHAMDAAVVERQREPVALEVGAKRRELFDWLQAYYLNPPRLRMPSFMEREFGIEGRSNRDYYPYRSLYHIAPDDLRKFYHTYYVPSQMTLAVIGDLDREEVLKKINETFATLPTRNVPSTNVVLRDPQRIRREFTWSFRPNINYFNAFKLYQLTEADHIMLLFITRLLDKRLNDQLRHGDRKATYGVGVNIYRYDQAALLFISSELKQSEFDFARSVIDRELAALRNGTIKDAEFISDRATITGKLRASHSAGKDLEQWLYNAFYNPRIHHNFPDLVTAFEKITKSEVETFARNHLVEQRQVLEIDYIQPLTQGMLFASGLVLLLLPIQIARRLLLQPLTMSQIRYVAHLRMPILARLSTFLILIIMIAVVGRLLVYGFQILIDRFIIGIENYWVQWSLYALFVTMLVFLLLLLLSRIPRKILIFKDSLVIKYFCYRSVIIPMSEIVELSLYRFSQVWLSYKLWKCIPLSFGIFSPAIYLRDKHGWSYFFRVRNRDECLEILQELCSQAAIECV